MSAPLLPARAVEMQKQRMTTREIAAALGVSVNQIAAWWRMLGYDPFLYHAAEIAEALAAGASIRKAVRSVGLTAGGYTMQRVEELGLRARSSSRREATLRRYRRKQPQCAICGILLVPYDPDDREQASWQNGTRDGVHCEYCREHADDRSSPADGGELCPELEAVNDQAAGVAAPAAHGGGGLADLVDPRESYHRHVDRVKVG